MEELGWPPDVFIYSNTTNISSFLVFTVTDLEKTDYILKYNVHAVASERSLTSESFLKAKFIFKKFIL